MQVKQFTSRKSAEEAAAEVRRNSPHLRRTTFQPVDDSGERFFVYHRGINDSLITLLLEDGTMGKETSVASVPSLLGVSGDFDLPGSGPVEGENQSCER